MGRKIKKNFICLCGEIDESKFYISNKNKCKKCILKKENLKYKNKSDEEKNYYKLKQKNWASKNLIKIRVLAAKHRALRKKIDFDIDTIFIEELLIKQNYKCKYSGVILDINSIGCKNYNININTLSIDRINSNIGYIKSNIVLTSAIVNNMKNDLSDEDFIKIITLIYNNNS